MYIDLCIYEVKSKYSQVIHVNISEQQCKIFVNLKKVFRIIVYIFIKNKVFSGKDLCVPIQDMYCHFQVLYHIKRDKKYIHSRKNDKLRTRTNLERPNKGHGRTSVCVKGFVNGVHDFAFGTNKCNLKDFL